MSAPQDVTQLLHRWQQGDSEAFNQLVPLVYDQLRRLAGNCMRAERPGHTLRATAVVHEAYLRLVDADVTFKDRVHFYAIAARLMRRILLDYARANASVKRGSGQPKVSLEDAAPVGVSASEALLQVDEALLRLAEFDRRKADLVELLYFGGLTYEEAAEALGVSAVTIHRDLKVAKAWLYKELQPSG